MRRARRGTRHPDRPVNGGRQDESIVVIHMLAQQVHTPRCTEHEFGHIIKRILIELSHTLAEIVHAHSIIKSMKTKQPNSKMCFICGLENPVGLHLHMYEVAPGVVETSY